MTKLNCLISGKSIKTIEQNIPVHYSCDDLRIPIRSYVEEMRKSILKWDQIAFFYNGILVDLVNR